MCRPRARKYLGGKGWDGLRERTQELNGRWKGFVMPVDRMDIEEEARENSNSLSLVNSREARIKIKSNLVR
jgi:hypothetical protein